jgi:hypothetical protein
MSDRKNEIFESLGASEVMNRPGALTFEVPVIDVPLPSNGKVYPEDNPLHSKKDVSITAMTATQENILTNKSFAKKGTLLTNLIQSCLTNKNIDVKEMLMGDRNTIMVSLRISGYGPDYKVKVTCPECDKPSQQEFRLDQLPIRKLEIEPISTGSNIFEFTLPSSKKKVHFKFLTGRDEEEIAITQAQKKKISVATDADLVTSGLQQMILSIQGVTDKNQIALALPKMPAFDSQALRRYIQDNEPGMQLKGEMVCPNCDHVGEVEMPLGAGFFWPGAE